MQALLADEWTETEVGGRGWDASRVEDNDKVYLVGLLDTLTRSRMYESVLAAFDFVARSLLRLSQLHAWCLRGEVSLVSFTPRALYSLVTRDSHRDSDS